MNMAAPTIRGDLDTVKITPVQRAARIKNLREKRKLERELKVRDRALRIRSNKSGGRRDSVDNAEKKHPRRARGSLSRDEIVKAAFDIIRVDGVEGLSMRRIADKLGCSVASPYAHFENQEEILRILITNGEKILTQDLRKAQSSATDVFGQLDAIAHAYWNFASENRHLHRLMFSASGGKLYRRSFPTLPTSYRVFLETIRRGISSGAIPHPRKSYTAIASTMWAWMYGLIVLDLNEMVRQPKGADPVNEGIEYFKRMLRSPLD